MFFRHLRDRAEGRRRHMRSRHGEHHHDRTHRHGGRRAFEHGDLRFLVLHLIGEQPRHGYEIIKAIEERSGGAYAPSPGAVYPTLTLLEELGHATVREADGNRRLYSATEAGRGFLDASRATLDAMLARLARMAAEAPPESIRNALDNLRGAVRERLSRGLLDDNARRSVAEALDRVAEIIRRS